MMVTSPHFCGLSRTRVWRSPACGAIWLDDDLDSHGEVECSCSRCGGSAMVMVGRVTAADVLRLVRTEESATA